MAEASGASGVVGTASRPLSGTVAPWARSSEPPPDPFRAEITGSLLSVPLPRRRGKRNAHVEGRNR